MGGIQINEIQEAKIDELWWMKQGRMFTSTGYGKKIPTRYKIKVGNRWYRVYQCIFSNSGTLYINRGKTEKGRNYQLKNVVDGDDIMEVITRSFVS